MRKQVSYAAASSSGALSLLDVSQRVISALAADTARSRSGQ